MERHLKNHPRQLHPDRSMVPSHVAVIMDGNGRWAQQRHLPRTLGHQQGVESIREVVREASKLKISILSIFAFSTENWKRSDQEVSFLMELLSDYLRKELDELDRHNVAIRTTGQVQDLPLKVYREIQRAVERTRTNTGLILNVALNYGGRDEIVRGCRKAMTYHMNHELSPEELTESVFASFLDTAGLPDPDLLIRTSGEQRISNFMLWQLSYTEMYFTNVLWPDFRGQHLREAVEDYQARQRRYGDV